VSGAGGDGLVAAYVGLGGNLGGEQAIEARFDAAIAAMRAWPGVRGVRRSSLYRSAPVVDGACGQEQPPYLNAVVELMLVPPVEPVPLVAALLALEGALGRDRAGAGWQSPRTIDLDLLVAGGLVVRQPGPPEAWLPHPRLARRAFALRPLAELAGDSLVLPGDGRTIADCLAAPEVTAQLAERVTRW
jgi:2-amino-4-hydroxy-6-hydroxymethyldihydropteridine diphosphokinase